MQKHGCLDWYTTTLGLLFLVLFVGLGVNPTSRADWLLENVLTFVFLPILVLTRARFPFSRLSYTLIFLFLCLHSVGAHFTYSQVPYDSWFKAVTGHSLNALLGWERNHYDRLVHFCYGFFLAYPIREVFLRIANVRGFWGYFLPLLATMSTSMVYELLEWGAAMVFGGDLGTAYLGTQGDQWDAQRDMSLATIGALIAMTVTASINVWLQRDFAREWAESLRVKRIKPLGEVAIAEALRDRDPSTG
jgi:putative membrane protein